MARILARPASARDVVTFVFEEIESLDASAWCGARASQLRISTMHDTRGYR
jgi:hypothetical protein